MLEINPKVKRAQKMVSSGKFSEAIIALTNLNEEDYSHPLSQTLLGWSLYHTGEVSKGVSLLEETSDEYPDFFEVHHYRGAMLNLAGDLFGSLASLQQAEKIQPENILIKLNLGATYAGLGQSDNALNVFQEAVDIAPKNADALGGKATVLAEQGFYAESELSFQQALQLAPTHTKNLINFATILQDKERYEESLILYERAEQVYASSPQLYMGECKALIGLEEVDAALDVFRMALNLFPRSSQLTECYCYALAEHRTVEQALSICNKFIVNNTINTRILSTLSVLLNEAEDFKKLFELSAVDRRVSHYEIKATESAVSKRIFLSDLVNAVLHHSTLTKSPRSHATRFGCHTGEIFGDKSSVFFQLELQLRAAVKEYIKNMKIDGDVHFSYKPKEIQLRGWSVVMDNQGHQISHTHPSAWLSGVCYLQLPDQVDDEVEQQGWLEFGSYPSQFIGSVKPSIQRVKPEIGSIFLFPSYMWHRTTPFNSDTQRICIAFDVSC